MTRPRAIRWRPAGFSLFPSASIPWDATTGVAGINVSLLLRRRPQVWGVDVGVASHLMGASGGLQVAAVSRAQVGLINVAGKLRGAQIGLINIAGRRFIPLLQVDTGVHNQQ